jgi:hypothetical protein
MRVGVWAAVILCAAAIAAPARAQNNPFATALGGPPPANIQFKPIDMSNLVVAPAMPAQQSRFNFSALIRKLTFTSSPNTRGVSPLPPPSAFPTYPDAKMIGTPPYQLGDPKAAKHPFQPVLPILDSKASGQ